MQPFYTTSRSLSVYAPHISWRFRPNCFLQCVYVRAYTYILCSAYTGWSVFHVITVLTCRNKQTAEKIIKRNFLIRDNLKLLISMFLRTFCNSPFWSPCMAKLQISIVSYSRPPYWFIFIFSDTNRVAAAGVEDLDVKRRYLFHFIFFFSFVGRIISQIPNVPNHWTTVVVQYARETFNYPRCPVTSVLLLLLLWSGVAYLKMTGNIS